MDSDASDREPSNPSTQDLQDEQREQLESSLPVPDQPSEPLSDFALQLIHHKDDPALITISQAERIQESLSKTYMVYPITVALADQVYTAKRRYSEFESLWTLMVKSHPAVLVPPIPQKHSIGDLTIKNGKDSGKKRVEERERLLKAFLVRSIKHPALVLFKPMHLFMMGKQSWHEILQTSGLAHLLVKRPKLAKSMGNLRKPDAQFQGALDFTGRFTAQVQYMQKSVKKIADHYKVLNKASSELGMHYNSWSLSEEELQAPIEGAGQAFDTCAGLAGELERSVNVDLGEQLYEFGLYATSIERLLDSRNKKHYEFESTSEQLIQKQHSLTKLEVSEHESQRIAAVLKQEGFQQKEQKGLLATLGSLVDNDPEGTRRNTISKLKDGLVELETKRENARKVLLDMNGNIQAELDRFQRDKISDMRQMLIRHAQSQKEYHEKACQAWYQARQSSN